MELRSGYTTGTCATIAARAAIRMIFEQKKISRENVLTPKGILVETDIWDPVFEAHSAECAVRKDAGDDPDVTNGMLVFARVNLLKTPDIVIDGGEGVGRVTKPGLSQPVGTAAINPIPRKMLEENVRFLLEEYAYEGGAEVIIRVPDGVKMAEKTFNPRLGIVGGISILGTSGIVEPMSEQAIIDTIHVEMDVKKQTEGEYLMIAPGNYGIDFIRETFDVDLDRAVKCSNYVGETLDYAIKIGLKGVLLIGHIGKFVKLAGGIMDTHSRNADARMDLIVSNALAETEDIALLRRIMNCVTTDDAVDLLKKAGICEAVMEHLLEKALYYTRIRVQDKLEIGMIMFSNVHGLLCKSENAEKLFSALEKDYA